MRQHKLPIFVILLAIASMYGVYHYPNTQVGQPFVQIIGARCGVIVDNFSDIDRVKHGFNMAYYLKVKYDTGVEIEKVDGRVWYTHEIGDNICFTITKRVPPYYVASLAIFFVLLFAVTMYIMIQFFFWLID